MPVITLLIAIALFIVFNFDQISSYLLMRTAYESYQQKEFGDAEVSYKMVRQRGDQSAVVSYNLGNALFRQDRYPEAIDEYKKALNTSVEDALILNNLGVAHFRMGELKSSLKIFKTALLLHPADTLIRQNYLLVSARIKVLKKAGRNDSGSNDKQENARESKNSSDEKRGTETRDKGAGEDQKVSEKNAEDLLKQLNLQEEALRGRINRKKQKVKVQSDEHDY